MAENVCKAYKDYFGGFRIFNSADLSDTVLFYGCYMELECADKLCVYLRRRGYGISSVCDTGGGRLLYSGVYGRASISFYAFNSNGNKGIACGLNNLQKIRDGEPLGGRTRAEDDFATDDDDDFLS